MEELLDEIKKTGQSRPVLLGVTCVFTWVGCVMLFLTFGDALLHKLGDEPDRSTLFLSMILLSAMASLVGSIMMFIRNSRGFLIYTLGQLLYVAGFLGLFILGWRATDGELILLAVFLIVPIGFIFLYKSQSHYFAK